MLISAVPPVMLQSAKNPGGLPKSVFDGLRSALAANRAQFYRDLPSGPFYCFNLYGFNHAGATIYPGVIDNWWRQGMIGGAKAHYDCIAAFSETDFTDDLKQIAVPSLVMHGDDDQIVPIADAAPLSAKLLRHATLKVYPGFPHGMCTTHADVIRCEGQTPRAPLHFRWRGALPDHALSPCAVIVFVRCCRMPARTITS